MPPAAAALSAVLELPSGIGGSGFWPSSARLALTAPSERATPSASAPAARRVVCDVMSASYVRDRPAIGAVTRVVGGRPGGARESPGIDPGALARNLAGGALGQRVDRHAVVLARPAVHRLDRAGAGVEAVAAALAEQDVVPRRALQRVLPSPADQQVV